MVEFQVSPCLDHLRVLGFESQAVHRMSKTYPLAFDLKKRRPGCVLLQAVMGGSTHIARMIPNEHWLIAMTDDMKVYNIPESELKKLVEHFGGTYQPLRRGTKT